LPALARSPTYPRPPQKILKQKKKKIKKNPGFLPASPWVLLSPQERLSPWLGTAARRGEERGVDHGELVGGSEKFLEKA